MLFDAIFIRALCDELDQELAGARVDKIHNPAKEEFVLHLRPRRDVEARDGAYKLLICLSPGRARAGLVQQAPENPLQPGMFCMLLRKHLQGASLTGVRQPGLDRILCFDFSGRTGIGDPVRLTLCAEFTGRRTNLLLLRDDLILDCLKRTDVTQGGRLLLPGARYELPPKNNYVQPSVEATLPFSSGCPPWGAASRSERGACAEHRPSCSALLEAYYNEKDRAERKRQQAGALLKLAETRSARVTRKLAAQRQELLRAQDREHLRVCAELILANQAVLEREAKGHCAYRLENYYDNNSLLSIPVNPALGPGANAQRYFKEYRKAKTAAGLLGDFISRGEAELQYLESVADLLRRCETPAELDALRHELETQGYCKTKQARQKKQRPLPPLEYASTEGLRILVGRNNLQNDQLSLKLAKPGDLWFHTRDIPGSHVILCAEGKTPGEQSILEAAMLAAWHSRARGPAGVDYTPASALKKPPGAPPGKVIYHRHQSIYAQPTEELVSALKK